MVLATLLVCNINAQNTDVEIAMQETKTEVFLKNCSFVRSDQVARFYSGGGVMIDVTMYTDIESNEKIGTIEFWYGGFFLGYLDMEHASDLITALEYTLDASNNSDKTSHFSIDYTAPGGINFIYGSHANGFFIPKPGLSLRKKWYSVNEYGVRTVSYSKTGFLEVKEIEKLISIIKESQITIEKEFVKQEVAESAKTIKEEKAIIEEEKRQAEEARIAEEKRKEANATDLYKKEVTTSIVQVQQEYTKLELTDSPIFTAYKKAISKLMQSRVLWDWETLDVINTVMQNLIKENCSIDKTALETQLAEKTTPEEIIEVFKASL